MKIPTPSKAAENQKEKGKSGIITHLLILQEEKKGGRKRNIKHVDQLKANGRYQHINITNAFTVNGLRQNKTDTKVICKMITLYYYENKERLKVK